MVNRICGWMMKGITLFLLGILLISGFACQSASTTNPTTECYPCTKTEEYTCIKTEEYTCTKFKSVQYLDTEVYTYTVNVPYTVTEERSLSYTTSDADVDRIEGWDNSYIRTYLVVTNTDTISGYFTVEFQCTLNNVTVSKFQVEYIYPSALFPCSKYFVESFDLAPNTNWTCATPKVIEHIGWGPVIKYLTEERIGTRKVSKTRQEPYEATCTREYEGICTREVQDICCPEE